MLRHNSVAGLVLVLIRILIHIPDLDCFGGETPKAPSSWLALDPLLRPWDAQLVRDTPSPGETNVLNRIEQVLRLAKPGADAALRRVRLTAVITVAVRRDSSFFVHDGTGGIRVVPAGGEGMATLVPGQVVAITGELGAGPRHPRISEARVRPLGTIALPSPPRPPVADVAAGVWHGQWIEVEGSIRDMLQGRDLAILLASDGYHFEAELPVGEGAAGSTRLPVEWLNARVVLHGVAFSDAGSEGQPGPVRLLLDGPGSIQVLRRAPADTFSVAAITARELREHRPSADELVRVQGEVLLHPAGGRLLLRTRDGCIEAALLEPLARRGTGVQGIELQVLEPVQPGDRIDLVGAVTRSGYPTWLIDAAYRRLSRGPSPSPSVVSVERAASGACDLDLITLEAQVTGMGRRQNGTKDAVVWTLRNGGTRFEVWASAADSAREGVEVGEGTWVQVTGLCRSTSSVSPGGIAFRVELRTPADLRVLERGRGFSRIPPAAALLAAGVVIFLAGLGTAFLRLQVSRRRSAESRARRTETSIRAVNYFAASLLEDPNEERILGDLARNCVEHLGFEACRIYLLQSRWDGLVQAASFPEPPDSKAGSAAEPVIPLGSGILGSVASTARAELVRAGTAPGESEAGGQLVVPIVAKGRVLGVIRSEHSQPGFLNQEHLEVLTAIASLCANKLVRLRAETRLRELNQDLERRIDRRTSELVAANEQLRREIGERVRTEKVQRALFEISEAVHAVADLPSLYARIHAIIGTLMRAESFYLALQDHHTGVVSFPYHRDAMDPAPAPRLGRRGMTEYVLRTGRATLADLDAIRLLKESGEYEQTGYPAAIWLGVPLTVEGRTFGVMAVQDRQDPKAFDEEDRRILSFVAGQTALAIERKRSEEELVERTRLLRESEERFGKAFHSTPAVLSIIRLSDERVVEINDAFLGASGFTREEVLGRTMGELNLWVDPSEKAEFLLRVREHGFVHSFEARLQTRRFTEESVLMSADTIVLNGEPCLLALSVIVTERKRAERELVCALAHERELSELKSRFVAMVSHEFRTPLGIIASSAEILEAYGDRLPAADRLANLRDIADATRQMSRMMEEVLLLGQVEAGKLDCRRAPLELGHWCRQLAGDVVSATDRQCPIEFSTTAPLPPAQADESLLRHILTNLLTNAVKYSPKGVPVELIVEPHSHLALFTVRDRGIGIPEADKLTLFQAFHRGRNVANRPGTGLGMTIVKRCVELHGGWISFESREGEGTTFVVALPLFSPQEAGAVPDATGGSPPSRPPHPPGDSSWATDS